jgi:predicted RNase H-like nuclease
MAQFPVRLVKRGAQIYFRRAEDPEAGDGAIVRETAARLVGADAQTIILTLLEQAKAGNYQVAKFLFALAGVFPAPKQMPIEEDAAEDFSLARSLCSHLGLPENPELDAELSRHITRPASPNNTHAVE